MIPRGLGAGACRALHDEAGQAVTALRISRLSVSGWPMGIGLLGMQERLESLGGHLEIESWPERGTRLVAYLPAGGIP